MSKSEITKTTLTTGGLKVHDILADYFTKDLKVKAAKSSVTEDDGREGGSVSDGNESNNGENKKHHHRHNKKHKKNKKRRKSHDEDDELLLVEEYKKRKLEYKELVRQEEIEKKKSRRISAESGSSKEENSSKKRSKHQDHKHLCKKHKSDNDQETPSNSKSTSTDASKKYDSRKKLMSTISLVKDDAPTNKETSWKLRTITIDSVNKEKNEESKHPDLSSIKVDIKILPEPLKTNTILEKGEKQYPRSEKEVEKQSSRTEKEVEKQSSRSEKEVEKHSSRTDKDRKKHSSRTEKSGKKHSSQTEKSGKKESAQNEKEEKRQSPETEDNLVDQAKENKHDHELQEEKNENAPQDPVTTTTNLEQTKIDNDQGEPIIIDKDRETNVTDDNQENVENKLEEKDTNFVLKKTSKISIQNLKNLDLTAGKEVEPNSDLAEKLEVEEGEVVDSDDDNDEEGNISDFFKGHVEDKEERKKKKKLKHKHKKKKKKKSKDNSPEQRTRRLSEPGHHHAHGSHYLEPDDRYYDDYVKLRRASRDRSHSPKRATGMRKPRKFQRESSMSMDLREKIDKKRLLEIARKNVLTMIEKGTLPSGISSNSLAQQQLVTLRAGGKSVAELTEFCKGLVNGKDYLSSDSSDEEGRRRALSEEEGDTPFINHPFKLREPLPHIRMNIPNAVQIPVRTADTAKLRQIFPVSSGNQHRIKELEWVPVEKTETTTSTTTTVSKKNKEPKAIMPPPPPPPPPLPPPPPPVVNPAPHVFAPQPTQLAIAPPLTMGASGSLVPMSGPLVETPQIAPTSIPTPVIPVQTVAPPVIQQPEPEPEQPPPPGVDISSIVAKRLNAVRRLQENPLDVQALNQMFQAQQQMKDWAHSKLQPGQFGAAPNTRLLTPEELSGPSPVWAKKNQLTNAAPLSDGIGMNLLRKMGWNPGEGLGKNKEGSLIPLMLDVKMDKKGLVSTADAGNVPVKKLNLPNKVRQDLSGKHPVSALMELCSKRKWGPPEYTLLDEGGPAHRKNFLFKVRVQGTDYQPSVSSPNKKQAKALAAQVCLQGLGLLPR